MAEPCNEESSDVCREVKRGGVHHHDDPLHLSTCSVRWKFINHFLTDLASFLLFLSSLPDNVSLAIVLKTS